MLLLLLGHNLVVLLIGVELLSTLIGNDPSAVFTFIIIWLFLQLLQLLLQVLLHLAIIHVFYLLDDDVWNATLSVCLVRVIVVYIDIIIINNLNNFR